MSASKKLFYNNTTAGLTVTIWWFNTTLKLKSFSSIVIAKHRSNTIIVQNNLKKAKY